MVAYATSDWTGSMASRNYDLRFVVQADIDQTATHIINKLETGRLDSKLIEKYICPLVEPHIFAANNRWPADKPLPIIPDFGELKALNESAGAKLASPSGSPSVGEADTPGSNASVDG